jgi:hypothetical protein
MAKFGRKFDRHKLSQDPIQLAWTVNQVRQLGEMAKQQDPIQLAWMVNQVGQLPRPSHSRTTFFTHGTSPWGSCGFILFVF